MPTRISRQPPIVYGAALLSVLSLFWSAYAITDLMQSGRFGLSVALAGDIGWITVLWAEYKGITITGRRWPVTAAGWAIALGVAALLVIHGEQAGGHAQAVAGPFVVVTGKVVWVFALEALKDPTSPTAEQRTELDTLMRNSAHQSAMLHARNKTVIDRIKAEAEITMARDETDFRVALDRAEKAAEIQRRTPLSIHMPAPAPAVEQGAGDIANAVDQVRELIAIAGESVRDSSANNAANAQISPEIGDRDPVASIADLAREQVAITASNTDAVNAIMRLRPGANRQSVAASVRRARSEVDGPYM